MKERKHQSGLTLLELLIAITIFGIIVVGLYQVLDHTLSAYESTRKQQALLSQARYAMERMVMFVQASDEIVSPANSLTQEQLTVSERVLNTYDNETHDYQLDGDDFLDADNDYDGLVNEGPEDRAEYISFMLDKNMTGNWKLIEKRPDYSKANPADNSQASVICQYVTEFNCRLFSTGLVEITLALENDNARVNLKTRARAWRVK